MTPLRGYLRFIYTKRIVKDVLPFVYGATATLSFILALVTAAIFIYRIGVPITVYERSLFISTCNSIVKWYIILALINLLCKFLLKIRIDKISTKVVYLLLFAKMLPAIFSSYEPYNWWETAVNFIDGFYYTLFLLVVVSTLYLSVGFSKILQANINPSKIISVGFLIIISIGAGLLMLPNSSVESVSAVDAFFISSSAVCVVGLTPFPINEVFTVMGQSIILLLIQVGGIGIMTLTCFFVFLFNGNVSTYTQMSLKDAVSSNLRISLVGILKGIFWTTLFVEFIGALMIWISVQDTLPGSMLYKIWFSVFHAISAFCNAGFSILPENLGSPLIAGNNAFFCEISSLIILGGLGFPVLINVLSFVKLKTSALFRGKKVYIPFNLNSRLVLGTTALLIIGGTIFIAFFEWNNAFENLSVTEKITQAFFNSVTPRTAGFSSLPPSAFRIQTVLLVIILMWIGGGAQSTAGGIKVNTVALFFAGLISGAKRSDKIELSGRQLSNVSSIHAMAVILLSIVVIFSATIVISFMEPRIPVLNLFYEVVSAISTVGLSLDTTPMLSNGGKILIMILMFLGRIGVITVIWGIINEKKHATYSYPTENIIIN